MQKKKKINQTKITNNNNNKTIRTHFSELSLQML